MNKIAIFASGSGSNAQNIANYFKDSSVVAVDCVLSNNPKAYVLDRFKGSTIDTYVFNRDDFYKSERVLEYLQSRDIDFIVLAGFLWLVPSYLTQKYANKIVNIHPALLPKYGGKGMYGMNVHKAVVEAKEPFSGITIHYVNEHYDEGNVIFQDKFVVQKEDSPEDVANKVHELEYKHFPRVIEEVMQGV